jgi:hypothetical protein
MQVPLPAVVPMPVPVPVPAPVVSRPPPEPAVSKYTLAAEMLFTFSGSKPQHLSEQGQTQIVRLGKRIKEQLPANELRTVRRPDNMAPRTFFLDYTRTLLPQILNTPCLELPPLPTEPARLKLRIVNSKNLPLEEYFKREKFRCLYNRLEGAREEGKTFLGRLKGIDSLVDYNWKNFRELP